jgi:hypothetical protein
MSGRVLLPCRQYVQNGKFSPDLLSIWATITAHADKTGRAFPGVDRIAALSGCRKASALTAIRTLENQKIIEVCRDQHNTYTVPRYHQGDPGNARNWISLPAAMIMTGSWAVFPKSAKICYLYLSAWAWPGRSADDWNVWEKTDGWTEWRKKDYPFDFIQESRIPLRIPGLPDRTSRFAREWLAKHGIIDVYWGTESTGLALPHDPPIISGATAILEKLQNRLEKNKRTGRATVNAILLSGSRNRRIAQAEVGIVQ